jgi:membrane protein YqaA with SNARE-associated domain
VARTGQDLVVIRYLAAAATIFGVNLLPAFGPPTWAVLVLFKLNWDLAPVPLVVLGALAAGLGRFCLAVATRRVRDRLSKRRVENLCALGEQVRRHRAGSVLGLGLFALSPVPSAQLFEAAGLIEVPLIPVTASFFVGRMVSYSLYIGAATAADRSFGSVFRSALTSPLGIAVQVGMLVAIVLLARVDWAARFSRN